MLLTLFACTTPEPAVEAPAPMDPDGWGPYAVGMSTVEWTDGRGKTLTADIWYPALPEGEIAEYEPSVLTGSALRDAPFDGRGGPYPVVGFSHGFGGIRFQSLFLTEHLASHGWVIISPDHPRNTFLDMDDSATFDVLLERPDDVRSAVDELYRLHGSGEDAWVDPEAGWVAMGHSFGAFTTLILGRGALDLAGLQKVCTEGDPAACGYFGDTIDPTAVDGHGFGDDRVLAAVPLSPGVWYAFDPTGAGLSELAPSLMLAGTQDDTLDYLEEARPTFEAAASPSTLLSFDKAGHYGFSDICRLVGAAMPECNGEEAGFADMEAVQAGTQTRVTAWLRAEILGEDGMDAFLADDELVTREDR